jgi:hypothetical protein
VRRKAIIKKKPERWMRITTLIRRDVKKKKVREKKREGDDNFLVFINISYYIKQTYTITFIHLLQI